jgi:hypothetical protein
MKKIKLNNKEIIFDDTKDIAREALNLKDPVEEYKALAANKDLKMSELIIEMTRNNPQLLTFLVFKGLKECFKKISIEENEKPCNFVKSLINQLEEKELYFYYMAELARKNLFTKESKNKIKSLKNSEDLKKYLDKLAIEFNLGINK